MADRSLWPSAVFVFSALVSFSACNMGADPASGNAGATDANPTNTPLNPVSTPAVAPTQSVLRRGLFNPVLTTAVGAGVPTHPQGGAGVPHTGGTYASAARAGAAVPSDKRHRPVPTGQADPSPPGTHLDLDVAQRRTLKGTIPHAGGSGPQAVGTTAARASLLARKQAFHQAEVEAAGQPISTLEELGERMAGALRAATRLEMRDLTPNASTRPAAPCGAAAAPAAIPTLALPAAVAAAPAAASSSSQTDVDMVAADIARVAVTNNAEQLVQAMHPPEAVVETIPPRSMARSADAPASSAPAAPAPTSVAASQGGAAGGSTACSPDCFEAKQAAAAFEKKVAKLQQQLRDKKTEVKVLKSMMHSSSAAGGAGVAAPTASSSASSSAPSSAAQQHIAQLEAKVAQLESHGATVMRDWRLRAGFFEEGDENAEALRIYWREQYFLNGGPAAAGKRIDRLEAVKREVVSRDSKLKREGQALAQLRIELEELEAQVKLDASKMGNDRQNKAVITKARSTARQAKEEKKRAQLALAQAALEAGDMRPTQQQLQASQEMEMRRLLSQSQQQLRLSAPSSSSTPASPAGAGAGVGHLEAPAPSRQPRHDCVDDEAQEDDEDEESQSGSAEDEEDEESESEEESKKSTNKMD